MSRFFVPVCRTFVLLSASCWWIGPFGLPWVPVEQGRPNSTIVDLEQILLQPERTVNLVGGLEHFLFFHILGIIYPNWLSYFSEGLKPPTRNSTWAYLNYVQFTWDHCRTSWDGFCHPKTWRQATCGIPRCVSMCVFGSWSVPMGISFFGIACPQGSFWTKRRIPGMRKRWRQVSGGEEIAWHE